MSIFTTAFAPRSRAPALHESALAKLKIAQSGARRDRTADLLHAMQASRCPACHLEVLSLTRALQSKDPLHFSVCFASSDRVISTCILQHAVTQRQYG
jgi:hypothetical protein